MTQSKLILMVLKANRVKQREVKLILDIDTTKYHNIAKEEDNFSKEEIKKLELIFPYLKGINYDDK